MKAVDNSNLLRYRDSGGFPPVAFVPGVSFAYDSGAKTIVFTNTTASEDGDFVKNVNITITDRKGNKVETAVSPTGFSYETAPTVVFTGGGGTGAAATAIVSGGRVIGITMTNAGSSYETVPAVSFTGGGGSGAAATAVMDGTTVGSVVLEGGVTAAIDVSDLDPSAGGIDVKATVVTDKGYVGDGIFKNMGATGTVGNWQLSISAAEENT